MRWKQIGDQACSVARTLSVIGDRWTILILRNAFLGIRRFNDFQNNLGVTRHVLADRLEQLVASGVFELRLYNEHPPRYEYRLTNKGRDLYSILLAMVSWGDKYTAGEAGPPLLYQHKSCGHVGMPHMRCDHCGELIEPRQMAALAGPGLSK